MNRSRLPNRRRASTWTFEHGGAQFFMTVGHYPSGNLGEVFVNAKHSNSMMDAFVSDAAILVSLCLQHGCEIETIRHALKKDHAGNAVTPIAAALDTIGGEP